MTQIDRRTDRLWRGQYEESINLFALTFIGISGEEQGTHEEEGEEERRGEERGREWSRSGLGRGMPGDYGGRAGEGAKFLAIGILLRVF